MKILAFGFVAAVALMSCQQQQFFTSSPEIDFIKKVDESYLKGDWTTNRSFYHDTATIYINTWGRNKLTADQVVEAFKAGVADYTEYSLSDDRYYEMIIDDQGQHWVHCWAEWKGLHKNGKEVRSVVNITWRVENNKILFAGFIFDTLPNHLATEADSVNAM